MKKIALTTKNELNIYMSPVRQQLLRQLSISSQPMTPKMLADKLNISASSVQHHIKKLMQLELIELDHTEIINGITASFYKPAQITVQIGLSSNDDLVQQRETLVQDSISQVYNGFRSQMKKRIARYQESDPENLSKWGDVLSGVVHLSETESKELMKLVYEFIQQHSEPKPDKSPWEYAVIVYNAEELEHE